jgi:fumarate reductase subunit C
MKETHNYTEYHPRWYRNRISTYWWTSRWVYMKFILRELSSIFVAYFVIIFLLLIRALGQGQPAYTEFLAWMKSPVLIVLNLISFFFLIFHTITWLNLTPKAMAVRMGGKRVPDLLITAPNYAAWIAISAILIWLILGG